MTLELRPDGGRCRVNLCIGRYWKVVVVGGEDDSSNHTNKKSPDISSFRLMEGEYSDYLNAIVADVCTTW